MAQERIHIPILCDTPIMVYEEMPMIPNAPKKHVMHLLRTQLRPSESLEEEWPLKPYGRRGVFGYVFKYTTGELYLYQRGEGEKQGPVPSIAMLNSNDWGVLYHMMVRHIRANPDEGGAKTVDPMQTPDRPLKRESVEGDAQTGSPSSKNKKVLYSITWQSRAVVSGIICFRACICCYEGKKGSEEVILETINTSCGVFQTLLNVPLVAWKERFGGPDDKIGSLFRSCCYWKDLLAVKKTLFPSASIQSSSC